MKGLTSLLRELVLELDQARDRDLEILERQNIILDQMELLLERMVKLLSLSSKTFFEKAIHQALEEFERRERQKKSKKAAGGFEIHCKDGALVAR